MAGTAQSGLFGPGVDEVRQAIAQQGQEQDMAYAQMPMGRGPVALMAGVGRNIGNVVNGLTGNEDPRIAKARAMQEAAQEVDGAGFSLMEDPQSYYKATYGALMRRGLTAEAAHVRDIALNETATQADIKLKNAQAEETVANIGKDTWKSLGKNGEFIFNSRTNEIKKNPSYTGVGTFKADNVINVGPPGLRPGDPGTLTIDANTTEGVAKLQEAIKETKDGGPGLIIYGKPTTPMNVNTNLPPTIKSFGQTVGDKSAEETYSLYKGARDASQNVNKAQQVIEALDDPNLIVGPGADARLAIAKTLNVAGADNQESITNTQSLISDLADATLSAIGTSGLGTGQGFTEKDKQMLQDARAGRIPMTKETLRYIASKAIQAQRYTVQNWNDQLSNFDDRTKNDLRSVGINTDPKPLPQIPKAKKYPTKEQVIQGVPQGWKPEVWNSLPEDRKAYIKGLMNNGQ